MFRCWDIYLELEKKNSNAIFKNLENDDSFIALKWAAEDR